MPLYEYYCAKCNSITEKLSSVAGRYDTPDCPTCGNLTNLKISAPAHPVMNPTRPVSPTKI